METTRWRRRSLVIGVVIAMLLALGVVAALATPDVNMTDPVSTPSHTFADGSTIAYIDPVGSTGTGVFHSFLRLDASKTYEGDDATGGNDTNEKGYDTDGTVEFDTKDDPHTHSILLSDIPILKIGDQFFREFVADINESNANDTTAALISLDDVEVYLTDDQMITGYPFTGAADLVWTLPDVVLLTDFQSGSGDGDIRLLIPVDAFDSVYIGAGEDCQYGSTTCDTYVVFYTEFGYTDGYFVEGGFEEWGTTDRPYLNVTKTAVPTYEQPIIGWDLTKGDDAAYTMFVGGSALTHQYSVGLQPIFGDPIVRIDGVITIENPSDRDALVESIDDMYAGSIPGTILSCSSGSLSDFSIPAGGTVTCTYEVVLGELVDGVNNVEVTILDEGIFSGEIDHAAFFGASDPVTFGDPVYTGYTTVTVDDDKDPQSLFPQKLTYPGDFPGGMWSQDYTADYACSTDVADYAGDGIDSYSVTNTATVVSGSTLLDSDTAKVDVTCYAPVVSKTAVGSYDERHTWDIDKSVDAALQSAFAGDPLSWTWTVTLTESSVDENFAVTGTIDVSLPPTDAEYPVTLDLSDSLNDASGTPGIITECTGGTWDGATGELMITTSQSEKVTASCTYVASPGDASATENTATVTLNNIDFTATAPVSFTANVINGTADVSDLQNDVDFPITVKAGDGPWEWTYVDGDVCSSTPGDYADGGMYSDGDANTATVTGSNGQYDEASASTAYTCYAPVVSKTANTTWDRSWEWTIEKAADQTELLLSDGQLFQVNYTVEVKATKTDDNYKVWGAITVENPAPMPMTVALSDVLDDATPVVIDDTTCNYSAGMLTIAAGGSETCDYSAAPVDGSATLNTATATINSIDFTATADVMWSATPTNEYDEVITVTDTNVGELGDVSAYDAPKTFTYSLWFGAHPDADVILACGDNSHPNTASIVSNDNALTDESSWTVDAFVACEQGCTLTQGYWKTHSQMGPAPYDDAWGNIGDFDGDSLLEEEGEDFFYSDQTWYEVFWTAPKKGNAYYILAHQWMAATLNILDGAGSTAEVDAALADAAEWFDKQSNTLERALKLKGKAGRAERAQLLEWAGILGDYNEGLVGPGHCDEDDTSNEGFDPAMLASAGFLVLLGGFEWIRKRREEQ